MNLGVLFRDPGRNSVSRRWDLSESGLISLEAGLDGREGCEMRCAGAVQKRCLMLQERRQLCTADASRRFGARKLLSYAEENEHAVQWTCHIGDDGSLIMKRRRGRPARQPPQNLAVARRAGAKAIGPANAPDRRNIA